MFCILYEENKEEVNVKVEEEEEEEDFRDDEKRDTGTFPNIPEIKQKHPEGMG